MALALGSGGTAAAILGPEGEGVSACDDFDGDGGIDLAVSTSGGAMLHTGMPAPDRHSIRLALYAPERDNRRGVGAVVEIRAGELYRRIFWTGEPETIGLGDRESIDILRVTWPRGVEQHDLDVAAGERWCVERIQRIEGSCPFLYAWNGETYEFITDVLGITPLGLPMAPGMMVPPDHDEYVLVRGEQMALRTEDGRSFYDVQFTEELREVTYLDRVRLDVVDHPVGTEVFPP